MNEVNMFGKESIVTAENYLAVGFESDGAHIVSWHLAPKRFRGDGRLWLLPVDIKGVSYEIICGGYEVKRKKSGMRISFDGAYDIKEHKGRPSCDFFGNYF
ncbi:MAG: hypothetical protein LBC13_02990, partial [Clostridiales bacterium]|nr:hypothetical protein [Clostridiales bacterium]